jgi:uncharacterized protein YeaO (DUF488 family)
MISIKRVYEAPGPSDGHRVLVDRLWPRGLKKESAAIDEWLKELAPSTELRRWFGHRRERWPEFQTRYQAELTSPALAGDLERLRKLGRQGSVTLLYAAHDEAANNAKVLQQVLTKRRH